MMFKKLVPSALALLLALSAPAGAASYRVPHLTLRPQNGWVQQYRPQWRPGGTSSGSTSGSTSGTTSGTTGSASPSASQQGLAAQVVARTNAARTAAGLPALTTDAAVQRAAQLRAQEIVQSFSHTRPNGAAFSSALTASGAVWQRAGENIAFGQSTPQAVVSAWLNSPGHRANLMNGSFTRIGVGCVQSGGTLYWVQLFTG